MRDDTLPIPENEIDWQMPDDTNPPEPIFNTNDNEDCQLTVNRYYSLALQYHEETIRLNNSYTALLVRQFKYGKELVNNQKFYDWAVSGPKDMSNVFGVDFEYYQAKFIEAFGSYDDWEAETGEVVKAPRVRTFDDLDRVLYILY